ncbi:hypothetical protein [Adhaeribacter rhizoryzae]|uniref:Uracil-DNA glycosylase n=1 Tax=Adhaeribacter rhizoryzae TaxID=2607907 RepID=A0A5M6D932_9BACT|nr:hypothetical protein [Adhaeribacter rhizoryzae]KAA5544048.1 hypothetical protein F0145_15845 [Adhaeribacter rhizoryzae]
MNHQEKNELLMAEYEIYFSELQTKFDEETKATLSLPLLMHIFPEYDNLARKVMVVGQETKGWYGALSDTTKNPTNIIGCYKKFELGKDYYSSPFWRFGKTLFSKLNPSNNPNGLLWTNLSKVDQNGSGVNQDVRKKNKAGYDLLVKEIAITKPEIVVFLTSWREDDTLKATFGKVTFEKIEDIPYEYLVRVKNENLPHNTFRTYHPRFLNDSTRSKYTINEIIEKVKNNCG